MGDKLNLGSEVRELKLGASFTNPRSTAFHTVRYDFKPASVDLTKSANIDVGSNNQVTVNVPHLDGAGTSQTVYKGSQKPYQKECVLIIDRNTGEITLEKLTSNIQVKKTRSETSSKPLPSLHDKSHDSSLAGPSGTSAINSRPKLKPKRTRHDRHREQSSVPQVQVPIQASIPPPTIHNASPLRSRSPPRRHRSPEVQRKPQSALASLPMISDYDVIPERTMPISNREKPSPIPPVAVVSDRLSESSSSCDSSDSSEDESDDNTNEDCISIPGYQSNDRGLGSSHPPSNILLPSYPEPHQLLTEDLRLSESGSD